MKPSQLISEYDAVKQANPGSIVFVRCGDFYETLRDDALTASRVIGITLTTRDGIPMTGIPAHSIGRYAVLLIENGHTFLLHDPQ